MVASNDLGLDALTQERLGSVASPRVAVGLSGGVDSAVTALLLKRAGVDVVGVYLKCWGAPSGGCGASVDLNDATRIASDLGIPFRHLDFTAEYKAEIIDYFYDSYARGLTPNTDILCNSIIKFGLFLDWASSNNYDFVATGHYARVARDQGIMRLLRGLDYSKDQSYFLYRLTQRQLQHALFPLGTLHKSTVRKFAEKNSLHVSAKKDSTGICFVGDVDIREFISQRLAPKRGLVQLLDGTVVGEHDGVWFYTIGQRHGFRLNTYMGVPMYVVSKDAERNILVVGPIKSVFRTTFEVADLHWISGSALQFPLEAISVRIRNLGKLVSAKVVASSDPSRLVVEASVAVFGVAPGQSAVFYIEDEVLGGGVIV